MGNSAFSNLDARPLCVVLNEICGCFYKDSGDKCAFSDLDVTPLHVVLMYFLGYICMDSEDKYAF